MPAGIPGFDQAASQEQRERNEAYIVIPSIVCGVALRQMTPMDWTRLTYYRNPYVVGGRITHAAAAQFVFFLAVEPFRKVWFRSPIDRALKSVEKFSVDQFDQQINDYIELTFRDQNECGKPTEDAPVACFVDWVVYRMMVEPFRWPEERTLNTPFRRIWPKLRCWEKDKGNIVKNKLSGAKADEFLAEVQRRVKDGTITQADLEKMNSPWVNSRRN